MSSDDGKKLGNLRIENGGRAGERRTLAEVELELALRALFYAMEGKEKNLRNVARGATHPLRMLVRRLREAKRARRDAVNYPLAKQIVRDLDWYVDDLFNRTGDHPKAA